MEEREIRRGIPEGLRIEDIHKVHLPQLHWAAWYRVKGGETRAFPLSTMAMKVIARARGNRRSGYVFVSRRSEDVRFHSVHRTWDRHVQPLGITIVGGKLVQIHDLRHVTASWLSQKGVSLDIIRVLLDHEDRDTTDRYVSHDLRAHGELLNLLPAIRKEA